MDGASNCDLHCSPALSIQHLAVPTALHQPVGMLCNAEACEVVCIRDVTTCTPLGHCRKYEAQNRAVVLEMIGDLPEADSKPPTNMLFVCKLNQVTTEEVSLANCKESIWACICVETVWVRGALLLRHDSNFDQGEYPIF